MSNVDVRPLPYFGVPTDLQRELVRDAKEKMDVPWFIRPVEAKPGAVGNILAFQRPTFYVERYALVTDVDTVDRMLLALRQVFGIDEPTKLVSGATLLSIWMKAEVKDLGEVEI